MPTSNQIVAESLKRIAQDQEMMEIARLAIQEVLVDFRDSRIFQMRNNGLVIKERNGEDSYVIRLGPEDAVRIGLHAIAKHIENSTI